MNYHNYIDDATRNKVMPCIIECLAAGKSVDQTAKKLVEIFGFDREQAKTIAWTESASIQTRRAIDSYRDSDVPAIQFCAAPDCCPTCKAMDGQVVPIEKSHGVGLPHVRCRCSWQPYWPEDASPSLQITKKSPQTLRQIFNGLVHRFFGRPGDK